MPTTPTDVQIPSGLPVLPGVVLTGSYLLTDVPPLNRGDTMDAIVLPHRRVALMVADVVGQGFGAALAVTQVRAILRERLTGGAGLLGALESVDAYAEHHPETCATTMCVAVLDLDNGHVEYGTAGHLPPMILTPFRPARMLPSEQGRPLGTGGDFHTGWAKLAPDDLLVLYTDGLVRTPARSLDLANAQLLQVAATALDRTMSGPAVQRGDEVCRAILNGAGTAGDVRDDVALIVGARSPAPATYSIRASASTASASTVRDGLRDWLDAIGAGLLDHIGLDHALAELVTNATQHAYPDDTRDAERPLWVDAALDDSGTVTVTVSDAGRWREEVSDGRGLMMAAALADSMDVRRGPRGTEVELRLKLARPVQLLQSEPEPRAAPVVDDHDGELHTVAARGSLVAKGPIDGVTIEVFDAALHEATRAGTASATVDLSGVTHLASPGVQSLFEFLARTKRAGAELTFLAPAGSPAAQIMTLVGLVSA
ncbi:SpoIIE family protein phosphatase [Nocardioides sp. Root151]|uniref:SpoIIE family protein phosphatase n=1 Tax=Nocardioides sp. Root151 TaxID=1736475 RepID=UPI000702A3C2|nr:SpoIIE family protein phosphatase [Nocardioides sp. Root151]KQZ74852.1 hypothetical protein ASD66_00200 [Nocardioides sp. Root151]